MSVPTPERRTTSAGPTRSLLGAFFAVVGLVWQTALLYGLAQFVVLMIGTFRAITESGESDPQVMAHGIGQALVPVIIWGGLGSFGLLTTLVTMLASRYRARWWFWSSWAFAIVYLLFVPVGTVLAIALMTILILKRKQFRQGFSMGANGGDSVEEESVAPAA